MPSPVVGREVKLPNGTSVRVVKSLHGLGGGRNKPCGNCGRKCFEFRGDDGNMHIVCPSRVSDYPFNVCPYTDWEFYMHKPKSGSQHWERRRKEELTWEK